MAKKRFVVKPRNVRVMEGGLQTTKGNIGFGGKTQKILTDESLAREIDSEYGLNGKRDVYVYEDERLEWHDRHDKETDGINHDKGGHRYQFIIPSLGRVEKQPRPKSWYFHFWNFINGHYKREIGFRLFGREFSIETGV